MLYSSAWIISNEWNKEKIVIDFTEFLRMPPIKPVTYPSPILKERARRVEVFNLELQKVADLMVKLMGTWGGVGLAAPQVGLPYQIMVVTDYPTDFRPMVLVNPDNIKFSGDVLLGDEGCLSLPGIRGLVQRHKEVRFTAQNVLGVEDEYTRVGYPARVFQHEYDHLQGVLITDRFSGGRLE